MRNGYKGQKISITQIMLAHGGDVINSDEKLDGTIFLLVFTLHGQF